MPSLNAPVPLPTSETPTDASEGVPRATAELAARPRLVVCDECDAVHERTALVPGQIAHCRRCHALLGRGHVVTPSGQLAFAIAAVVFLLIGNFAPLVTLDLRGINLTVTLPHAISLTWRVGEPLVAVLAAATAIVFPALMVGLRLYVLGFLVAGHVPPAFGLAMRCMRWATDWSMVEVLLLSALVSIVRSAGIADVVPGMGLLAYAALTLLLTSITASGMHGMWKLGSRLGAG